MYNLLPATVIKVLHGENFEIEVLLQIIAVFECHCPDKKFDLEVGQQK